MDWYLFVLNVLLVVSGAHLMRVLLEPVFSWFRRKMHGPSGVFEEKAFVKPQAEPPQPPTEEEAAAFLKKFHEARLAGWDLQLVPGCLSMHGAYIGPERMAEKLRWERRMHELDRAP